MINTVFNKFLVTYSLLSGSAIKFLVSEVSLANLYYDEMKHKIYHFITVTALLGPVNPEHENP